MLIMKADLSAFHKVFEKADSLDEPVIFPTDTINGIGASVFNAKANEKIYEIKGREMNKPFPVLVGTVEQLIQIAEPTDKALEFMNSCPVPCTAVIRAKDNVHPLMKLNGNIAVRLVKTGVIAEFLKSFGAVTATSANLSGETYTHDTEHMVKKFQAKVRFILYETCVRTEPSAIVDFSLTPPKIIRNSGIIPLTL